MREYTQAQTHRHRLWPPSPGSWGSQGGGPCIAPPGWEAVGGGWGEISDRDLGRRSSVVGIWLQHECWVAMDSYQPRWLCPFIWNGQDSDHVGTLEEALSTVPCAREVLSGCQPLHRSRQGGPGPPPGDPTVPRVPVLPGRRQAGTGPPPPRGRCLAPASPPPDIQRALGRPKGTLHP